MIRRLLLQHQRLWLLTIAVLGALFGLLLLLGALQLYFDFRSVLTGRSDLSQAQYIVINKEVSTMNTFLGQKGFSSAEISELKAVKGIRDVGALTGCRFDVNVTMGGGAIEGVPGMYSDFFFEAAPEAFLDVQSDRWHWQEGDSVVPLVVPKDFLRLYNFVYAPSQGLPQVTEEMLMLVPFNIVIKNKGTNVFYKGRLAGFSERINSILAPKNFVDWSNEQYGPKVTADNEVKFLPSRIILQCDDASSPELAEFMSEKNYQTNSENLKNSRLSSLLRVIMNVCVGIGGLIIVLALLIFLLYTQLLISRSSYELQTLIRIGYNPKMLTARYMRYYGLIYLGILIVVVAVLWIGKSLFAGFMDEKGFPVPDGVSMPVILLGVGFMLLFLVVNFFTVWLGLRKLAMPR
ncbi:MAG: ABC transporter permease [Bacteroidia bacterium]